MKKVLFAAALVLLAAPLASAQATQGMAWVTYQQDISAASYTYCRMVGVNDDPWQSPLKGPAAVLTVGSSTTVTEAVAGTDPFLRVSVGDMLIVRTGENSTDRVSVATKVDDGEITVSSAVDWSNVYEFEWLKRQCGTGATDGWIGVGAFSTLQAQLEVTAFSATTIDHILQCAIGAGLPVDVDTSTVNATGQKAVVVASGVYDRCRFGLKITGDTGTNTSNAFIAVKR